jgi:hypothetical protein
MRERSQDDQRLWWCDTRDVFGRVSRATLAIAGDDALAAGGILHTYQPEKGASALAVGLGTAGIASAGAATTPDGKTIAPVAEAVSRVIKWGEKQQLRYVRLPGKVLAVITAEGVQLYEWTVSGLGPKVAAWHRTDFAAELVRYAGQIAARVALSNGQIAILSSRRGPLHRRARRAVSEIVGTATPT